MDEFGAISSAQPYKDTTVKRYHMYFTLAKSLLMLNSFVSGLTSHYRYLNGSVSLAVLTARPAFKKFTDTSSFPSKGSAILQLEG